jgi:transcriptional repressor NrdR
MRCPHCKELEDRVVDSRLAEDGAAIRRRRECAGCGRRYTTFERAEVVGLKVVKRSGEREAFEAGKVADGIRKACKNRPVGEERIRTEAAAVEESLRGTGAAEVSSEDVGMAVLERLRDLDEVAYVRFASVYREFQEATDFEREIVQLRKSTPPKAGSREGGDGQ